MQDDDPNRHGNGYHPHYPYNPQPPVNPSQTKVKKSRYKSLCICISALIIGSLTVFIAVCVYLNTQLHSAGEYPFNLDDWTMDSAAFAGGYEALIFEGNNQKTGKKGAIKVFLEQPDGNKEFDLKDGTIHDMKQRKLIDEATKITISRKAAIESHKKEVNALKATTDANCPWIIPLLGEAQNVQIERGVTFKEPRKAPVIATEFMRGGSMEDMIKKKAANNESIQLSTLQRWKEQMMEAGQCAANQDVLFTDRNYKNFVLDHQDADQANVYVIDIALSDEAWHVHLWKTGGYEDETKQKNKNKI